MLERPPSTDAERRRKHRERQRRYLRRQEESHVSVTLDITPEETDKLSRLHYLPAGELENRKRIAEAIHALLAKIIIE